MPQTDIISTNKQLINEVLQSSYKCAETLELNLFHGHICIKYLGKQAIQTNPSKFDERSFSDMYLCISRLKRGREIQDFMFWGMKFQRDAPAKDILVLNKSSLGLGT